MLICVLVSTHESILNKKRKLSTMCGFLARLYEINCFISLLIKTVCLKLN